MTQRGVSLAILTISSSLMLANANEKTAKNDPDAMICKSEARTNTRFPTKTCRTRAQWDALIEQSKRDASDAINKPAINRGDNG